MTSVLRTIALVACLLAAAPSHADEARLAAAHELLEAMEMERNFEQMIEVALDAQLSQKPELAAYRPVFRAFFAKHMSYPALAPKLAAIYAAEFTTEEMSQVRAFYATPAGRKFTQRMPELFAKGAQVGQEAVQAHLPELVEMIQAEQQRQKPASAPAGG
jgi:uncharacterized protein